MKPRSTIRSAVMSAIAALALVLLTASPAMAETVIGIGRDTDFINESYDFKKPTGCAAHTVYEWPSMPSGWNDKLDSLEAYSGCSAIVYEHENFGGAALACPCSTMGVLEDEVSSVRFFGQDADVDLDLVVDQLNSIFDLVAESTDPLVCSALAALSPGVAGVAEIDQTGDTYVLGSLFWDCPPYNPAP